MGRSPHATTTSTDPEPELATKQSLDSGLPADQPDLARVLSSLS